MGDSISNEQWKWIDPDSKSHGVLLSDRIKYYIEKIGLIDPSDFREDSLGPASYNLRVGNEYYHNDKRLKPKDDGAIVIPSNGLVYVKLKEKLNIPFYLVAQHDLKVRQVYRGLLAGRSLQIDPGYSGHINYPIFNFTEEDREIFVDDEITVMCFIKTSTFAEKEDLRNVNSEEQLRQSKRKGIENNECKLFPVHSDRSIPKYWYGGEKHKNTVESIYRTLNRWRKIAIWSAIGFVITILIGIITPIIGHTKWMSDKVIDLNREVSSISASLELLREEIETNPQTDVTESEKMSTSSANEGESVDAEVPSTQDRDP